MLEALSPSSDAAVPAFSGRGPVVWQDADGLGPAAGTVLQKPDLVAPGVAITSTVGTGYLAYSGTSMAAPHVAGIVAQLFQADPTATPAEIEDALKSSAYKYSFGAPYESAGGVTTSYDKGTGLVDVVAAVQALRG